VAGRASPSTNFLGARRGPGGSLRPHARLPGQGGWGGQEGFFSAVHPGGAGPIPGAQVDNKKPHGGPPGRGGGPPPMWAAGDARPPLSHAWGRGLLVVFFENNGARLPGPLMGGGGNRFAPYWLRALSSLGRARWGRGGDGFPMGLERLFRGPLPPIKHINQNKNPQAVRPGVYRGGETGGHPLDSRGGHLYAGSPSALSFPHPRSGRGGVGHPAGGAPGGRGGQHSRTRPRGEWAGGKVFRTACFNSPGLFSFLATGGKGGNRGARSSPAPAIGALGPPHALGSVSGRQFCRGKWDPFYPPWGGRNSAQVG
jgi:hypothetical protein